MSFDDSFDRISNKFTRRQAVLHADMSHGDAVIHTDGIELERYTTCLAHCLFCQFAEFLQMAMTGNDVNIRIADADERLSHIAIRHPAGFQKTAMRRTLGT